jgi:hypothetical protein
VRWLIAPLAAAALSTAAFAQAPADNRTDLPIIGSETAEDAQGDVMRLLVIGDALAGGLGAGMTRRAEAEGGFEIANRFKEESGAARPEVHDWAVALPKILEGNEFDAVVVLLGANDRQEIRSEGGRLSFGTPEWQAAYTQQLDRILDAVKTAGLPVFWVAPPPMGDFRYDADVRAIAELQKAQVEAKGGRFVDVRGSFLGPDGQYAERGVDDTGDFRKLRASDGVNFYKEGNNRFGQLVLAEIRSAEKTDLAAAPQKETKDEKPAADGPSSPSFGQENVDGTVSEFQPEVTVAAKAVEKGTPTAALIMSKRPVPAQGSAAEKLFTSGESQDAKPGRFDDFSYTPPAE